MRKLYPEIEPFAQGMLDVGDGHRLYWECCGNPLGKPALVLHGGPGSGAGAYWRRFFDPAVYRVVPFDQRGCGRSTPDAGDMRTDLSTNTPDGLPIWTSAPAWRATIGPTTRCCAPNAPSANAVSPSSTGRWRALRHTTASPRGVGDIVRAGLVLTQFEYRYLPDPR